MASAAPSTNLIVLPPPASRPTPQQPRHDWRNGTFQQSPEMVIATAIFKVMPAAAKEEVRRRIRTMEIFDPVFADALTILNKIK